MERYHPDFIEMIARTCHEANRAYCVSIGDNSHKSWDEAPDWQKDSAIAGVTKKLSKPWLTSEDMHNEWVIHKVEDGWEYGEVKDPEAKTHPCLVAYSELPEEQRVKDSLFSNIVSAFN